jgi:hypothetical protein
VLQFALFKVRHHQKYHKVIPMNQVQEYSPSLLDNNLPAEMFDETYKFRNARKIGV